MPLHFADWLGQHLPHFVLGMYRGRYGTYTAVINAFSMGNGFSQLSFSIAVWIYPE